MTISSGRESVHYGETLIKVKGGIHLSGYPLGALSELGLAAEDISIRPHIVTYDVKVSDFGPETPADVQIHVGHVIITFHLIHYDRGVLETMVAESWGGLSEGLVDPPLGGGGLQVLGFLRAGIPGPAGRLLAGRKQMYASGNHFFSLNLICAHLDDPWRFRMCHLYEQPVMWKIGAKVEVAEVKVRALPYQDPLQSGGSLASGGIEIDGIIYTRINEFRSSGAIIFDRVLDT